MASTPGTEDTNEAELLASARLLDQADEEGEDNGESQIKVEESNGDDSMQNGDAKVKAEPEAEAEAPVASTSKGRGRPKMTDEERQEAQRRKEQQREEEADSEVRMRTRTVGRESSC